MGQQAIVTALQNQVASGRVGHAYLFTGTRGTGKTTCAKIFAKAVNCLDPHEGDPCGQCEVCRGIDDGSILDVVEIDAASNNGVDNIRDLRDETAYTPSVCRYKVYIIDEVHMLSIAAFNALLKIMEEPPAHVIFILATTEIHKVPATILSRCQRYDFGRIQPEDIARRVEKVAAAEEIQLTGGAAALIGRLADGALRDALSILDTCAGVAPQVDEDLVRRMAGVTDKSYLFRISDAVAAGDAVAALEEVAQLRQKSVDVKRLCEELISHYRNLMLAALPGGRGLLVGIAPEDEKLYLEKAAGVPQAKAVQAIRQLGGALEKMGRGTDQRIELELALFALTEEPAAAVQPAAAQAAPAPAVAPVQAQPAPFITRAQAAPSAASDLPPWESAPDVPAPVTDAGQPPLAADAQDAPPWEAEPIQAAEVPQPKAWAKPQQGGHAADVPFAPVAAQDKAAAAGGPQPFPHWPKVLEELEKRDPMLIAYLRRSRAYFDGRRVLIDGGDTFRDFIRVNKESQALIKQLIEQCSGVRCGIGPYMPPAKKQEQIQNIEDTLKALEQQGVTVVYNDKG